MGPFPAAREPFTIGTLVEPLMALRAGDRLDVYDIGSLPGAGARGGSTAPTA